VVPYPASPTARLEAIVGTFEFTDDQDAPPATVRALPREPEVDTNIPLRDVSKAAATRRFS
jgi:hypothetical protein